MQAISLERSNFAQTAVASLASFVALALLGWVLAYWTWAWFAPRLEPRIPAATQAGDRVEIAYGLFRGIQRDGTAPRGSAITLLGVVAASGTQPGYAVLRVDAKPTVAIREGGEIEAGVRLAEVRADHVVLERGGVRETLVWPGKISAIVSAAPRAGN